jgi:hypothetical protein
VFDVWCCGLFCVNITAVVAHLFLLVFLSYVIYSVIGFVSYSCCKEGSPYELYMDLPLNINDYLYTQLCQWIFPIHAICILIYFKILPVTQTELNNYVTVSNIIETI